jgi:eukaryotic-like serine/threonine-protein kinase
MAMKITLVGTEGILAGQEFAIDGSDIYDVGRAADCDLHIPLVPHCQVVSRHHCRFTVNQGHVSVCDNGSRNGTFVNGTRIGQGSTDAGELRGWSLKTGDEIRLGNLAFRVAITDDGADCFGGEDRSSERECAQVCSPA